MKILPTLSLIIAVLTLASMPCMLWAQTSSSDRERVYQIEVALFAHDQGQPLHRTQAHLTEFAEAAVLTVPAERYAHIHYRSPASETVVLPLSEWLNWLERQALNQAQGPFIGPLEPVVTPAPLIYYPITELALLEHSQTFGRAVERINQSGDFHLFYAESWVQRSDASGRTWPMRIGPHHQVLRNLEALPWPTPKHVSITHGPLIDGQLSVHRTQFLQIHLTVFNHKPMTQTHGPLALEWRYPTGFWVEGIEASRTVQANTLVYFDHPNLAALVYVSEQAP